MLKTEHTFRTGLLRFKEASFRGTTPSRAQVAEATARRKAIYEELHPETPASQNAARKTSDNLSFVSTTAEATGRDRRTVERDAARGESLGRETLQAVTGTSLDKGVELDARNLKEIDGLGLTPRRTAVIAGATENQSRSRML